MSVPELKQICHICSEEVTDADYRRELTCSYAGCPSSGHGYHEGCITKYLRHLKSRVDLLIGYPCPVVLDKGTHCSGRIVGTRHRQPLNQKKKKKRVEAAAAAAAPAKPKAQVPKAGEVRSAVAAATAAMRPAAEALPRQAGAPVNNIKSASSALPTARRVDAVAPGSGPAARLKGIASTIIDFSSKSPENSVRQRFIPGWTELETVAKVNRGKVLALQAKAHAGAAWSLMAPISSNCGQTDAAAKVKEVGDMNARQSPQRHQNIIDDQTPEPLDTKPFVMRQRDVVKTWDLGNSNQNPFETLAGDFFLSQEDFPAFPVAAPAPYIFNASGTAFPDAGPPAYTGSISVKMEARSKYIPRNGSGISFGNSLQAPMSAADDMEEEQAKGMTSESPVAPVVENKCDPIVYYHELYPTDDDQWAVMDSYGNYMYVQDVYGPNPEVVESHDEVTGVVVYYVPIRESLWKEMQATVVVNDAPVGDGAVICHVPDREIIPAGPAVSPYDMPTVVQSEPDPVDAAGKTGFTSRIATKPNGTLNVDLQAVTMLHPDRGVVHDEQDGEDLDDLLALCLVNVPGASGHAPGLGDQPLQQQLLSVQVPHQQFYHGEAAFAQNSYGNAGYIVGAPVGTADDAVGEEVDSLMQLLCV